MKQIKMVDLAGQHQKLRPEIDQAIDEVIKSSAFINGFPVKEFSKALENYLNVKHVVPCANGTDALQIALMSLNLSAGDEVIVPAFNYVAAAEVVALLGLKVVFADVDSQTFNISVKSVEKKITSRTRAVIVVHLFGQCSDMEELNQLAEKHNLFLVEDAAQALGASLKFSNGEQKMAGAMGDIGITSFFPSKNLGCMGDGGAIFTNNTNLFESIRKICNHGQSKKYYFDTVGVNSRLDSIQAAVLNIKIKHLQEYCMARRKAAEIYNKLLNSPGLVTPFVKNEIHVYNQYTIKIPYKRDKVAEFLTSKGVPFMIYYPLPLHKQKAYEKFGSHNLNNSEILCKEVLSLPMHTELDFDQQSFICENLLLGLKNL